MNMIYEFYKTEDPSWCETIMLVAFALLNVSSRVARIVSTKDSTSSKTLNHVMKLASKIHCFDSYPIMEVLLAFIVNVRCELRQSSENTAVAQVIENIEHSLHRLFVEGINCIGHYKAGLASRKSFRQQGRLSFVDWCRESFIAIQRDEMSKDEAVSFGITGFYIPTISQGEENIGARIGEVKWIDVNEDSISFFINRREMIRNDSDMFPRGRQLIRIPYSSVSTGDDMDHLTVFTSDDEYCAIGVTLPPSEWEQSGLSDLEEFKSYDDKHRNQCTVKIFVKRVEYDSFLQALQRKQIYMMKTAESRADHELKGYGRQETRAIAFRTPVRDVDRNSDFVLQNPTLRLKKLPPMMKSGQKHKSMHHDDSSHHRNDSAAEITPHPPHKYDAPKTESVHQDSCGVSESSNLGRLSAIWCATNYHHANASSFLDSPDKEEADKIVQTVLTLDDAFQRASTALQEIQMIHDEVSRLGLFHRTAIETIRLGNAYDTIRDVASGWKERRRSVEQSMASMLQGTISRKSCNE